MTTAQGGRAPQPDDGDGLYESYGRPLEAEHWGEYVAISPGGEVLLGATLTEVLKRAAEAFGPGNEIFRVGERVVGRWV